MPLTGSGTTLDWNSPSGFLRTVTAIAAESDGTRISLSQDLALDVGEWVLINNIPGYEHIHRVVSVVDARTFVIDTEFVAGTVPGSGQIIKGTTLSASEAAQWATVSTGITVTSEGTTNDGTRIINYGNGTVNPRININGFLIIPERTKILFPTGAPSNSVHVTSTGLLMVGQDREVNGDSYRPTWDAIVLTKLDQSDENETDADILVDGHLVMWGGHIHLGGYVTFQTTSTVTLYTGRFICFNRDRSQRIRQRSPRLRMIEDVRTVGNISFNNFVAALESGGYRAESNDFMAFQNLSSDIGGSDTVFQIRNFDGRGLTGAGDSWHGARTEMLNVGFEEELRMTHNSTTAGDPIYPITAVIKEMEYRVDDENGRDVAGMEIWIPDIDNGNRATREAQWQDGETRDTSATVPVIVVTEAGGLGYGNIITDYIREGQSAGGAYGNARSDWTGSATAIHDYRTMSADWRALTPHYYVSFLYELETVANVPLHGRGRGYLENRVFDDPFLSNTAVNADGRPEGTTVDDMGNPLLDDDGNPVIAAGDYTGLALDHEARTLTITEDHTLDEIYDWLKARKLLDRQGFPSFGTMYGVPDGNALGLRDLTVTASNAVVSEGNIFHSLTTTGEAETDGTGEFNVATTDTFGSRIVIRTNVQEGRIYLENRGADPLAVDTDYSGGSVSILRPAGAVVDYVIKADGYNALRGVLDTSEATALDLVLSRNPAIDIGLTLQDNIAFNFVDGGKSQFVLDDSPSLRAELEQSKRELDHALGSAEGLMFMFNYMADDAVLDGQPVLIMSDRILIDERVLDFVKQAPPAIPASTAVFFGAAVYNRDRTTPYTPPYVNDDRVCIDGQTAPVVLNTQNAESATRRIISDQAFIDALGADGVGRIESQLNRVFNIPQVPPVGDPEPQFGTLDDADNITSTTDYATFNANTGVGPFVVVLPVLGLAVDGDILASISTGDVAAPSGVRHRLQITYTIPGSGVHQSIFDSGFTNEAIPAKSVTDAVLPANATRLNLLYATDGASPGNVIRFNGVRLSRRVYSDYIRRMDSRISDTDTRAINILADTDRLDRGFTDDHIENLLGIPQIGEDTAANRTTLETLLLASRRHFLDLGSFWGNGNLASSENDDEFAQFMTQDFNSDSTIILIPELLATADSRLFIKVLPVENTSTPRHGVSVYWSTGDGDFPGTLIQTTGLVDTTTTPELVINGFLLPHDVVWVRIQYNQESPFEQAILRINSLRLETPPELYANSDLLELHSEIDSILTAVNNLQSGMGGITTTLTPAQAAQLMEIHTRSASILARANALPTSGLDTANTQRQERIENHVSAVDARLTAARAAMLDNLDAPISGISAGGGGGLTTDQANDLATILSRVDVATSTRTAGGTYAAPPSAADITAAIFGRTLDNAAAANSFERAIIGIENNASTIVADFEEFRNLMTDTRIGRLDNLDQSVSGLTERVEAGLLDDTDGRAFLANIEARVGAALADEDVSAQSIAAAVWSVNASGLTDTASIGELLAGYVAPDNASIADIARRLTAQRAANLDVLPGYAMTLDNIANAFTGLRNDFTSERAELLDNLDIAVSTRLAASAYAAPDDSAVLAAIANIPGGGGGGLTTAQADALNTILSRVDASVSSRLGGAAYTPPDNAGILAAIGNISGSGGGLTTGQAQQLSDLNTRLTAARAAMLDNLDAPISGISAGGGGLTTDQADMLATALSNTTATLEHLDRLLDGDRTHFLDFEPLNASQHGSIENPENAHSATEFATWNTLTSFGGVSDRQIRLTNPESLNIVGGRILMHIEPVARAVLVGSHRLTITISDGGNMIPVEDSTRIAADTPAYDIDADFPSGAVLIMNYEQFNNADIPILDANTGTPIRFNQLRVEAAGEPYGNSDLLEIHSELDVILARVDVATSTRLASAAYTAADNAGVLAAIAAIPAGGLTADQNTALTTILGRVDVDVSTRLAAIDYRVPDFGGVNELLARLTPTRATNLDNLDQTISGLAARIEAGLLDDVDGQAFLDAIEMRVGEALANENIAAASIATAVWSAQTADLSVVDSIGMRLRSLTASRIASLDRLDVDVSTRLSAAAYTAPDNADVLAAIATIAIPSAVDVSTAVWGAATTGFAAGTVGGHVRQLANTDLAGITLAVNNVLDRLPAGAIDEIRDNAELARQIAANNYEISDTEWIVYADDGTTPLVRYTLLTDAAGRDTGRTRQ